MFDAVCIMGIGRVGNPQIIPRSAIGTTFADNPFTRPGGGLPFVDIMPEPPPEILAAMACGKSVAYKRHCGDWKWVIQSRRRRKQLVTQSDIKGLAALKGVLNGGLDVR